jgi:hypothetical protein
VRAQSILGHQLQSDLTRKVRLNAAFDIYLGKLGSLELDVLAQLLALARDIGLFGSEVAGHHRCHMNTINL